MIPSKEQIAGDFEMMGRLNKRQGRFFYNFCLEDHVPQTHLLRQIDKVLDLSDVRQKLAPYYSNIGRPSLEPELMLRMLPVYPQVDGTRCIEGEASPVTCRDARKHAS